jgi:PAS domain S-box-containing protein
MRFFSPTSKPSGPGKSADFTGKSCFLAMNGLEEPCPWCPLGKLVNGSFNQSGYFSPISGLYYDLTCQALNWHGHEAVAFYCHDTTEEKKGRAQVEFDKQSLELIVNNLPVGVAAIEIRDGQVIANAVNPRLSELMGMNAEDFVSPAPIWTSRVNPGDRQKLHEALSRIRDTNESVTVEFRFLSTSNEEHWIHSEAVSLEQGDKKLVFLAVNDVTSEKHAEGEVLRSQEIYKAAVEETHLTAWEYDLESHAVKLADNVSTAKNLALRGIPLNAKDVIKAAENVMDKPSAIALREMNKAIDEGAPKASCEVTFKRRDGNPAITDRINVTVIYDADKKPLKAIGIARDVSAEKRDEEKYQAAFHVLDDVHAFSLGSFRFNLTQNYCFDPQSPYEWIRSLSRKSTVDTFFGQLANTIPDPAISKRIAEEFTSKALLKDFSAGKTKLTAEFPSRFKDGVDHWCQGYIFLFLNPRSGDVEGLAYAVSIDERKKTENVISHLTSKKFDYIGIIHLRDKTIEFINKIPLIRYGSIAPSPYEAWRTYIKANFIVPQERPSYDKGTELDVIEEELKAHGDYAFTWHQHSDGALTHKQNIYSWLDEKNGDVLILRSDITRTYEEEQRQLRLLQDALKSAEEANESKSEFLSRISHDIRTPISIIKSMTAFALQDLDNEEKLREDLKNIDSSNTFLLSLINDVLDISKIESGKIELYPEPYLFKDYLTNIVQMGQSLCSNKGLHFVLEKSGAVAMIKIDHIRLNQITLNLLSNAVKYTPIGGTVTFGARSEKDPRKKGYLLCHLEFKDTGIGMSEEFQKKMFEPFTQEYDNPNRPKANTGTGLGLTIVKRLVDLLGGTITVKSERGKGTAIGVNFSAPEVSGGAVSEQETTNLSALPPLQGKVLLCEDNQVNQAIAKRILTSFGLDVDIASNGVEGVDAFKASKPGDYLAILMDIQMPFMNGYEATMKIRSLRRADAKKIPIIAMTADAFKAALEKSKAAGMSDYLTKPLDPKKIREVLASIKA